jgi:ArsR family transcriptional regulator
MIETHVCGNTESNPVESVLDAERAAALADLLRTMGDANRVRILSLLMDHELCVHDIAALMEMSQSAISHQMRVLRQARLVRARKDGRHVYYTLDDDHVRELFAVGLAHVDEG